MLTLTESSHPAQQAALNSIKQVRAKNKEGWLALYADDILLQDPVGVSMLDPSGEGHRGKTAIAAFWDMAIAPGSIDFELRESYPCGNECANVGTMINTLNGIEIKVDLVIVYRVNAAGKIDSLKAYWDFNQVAEKMQQAMA